MGLWNKIVGEDATHTAAKKNRPEDFIDLSDYNSTEKPGEAGAATWVRFAELRALDDLKHFSSYVYDGHVLVIDFTKVQGDEILLRRLTNELRKLVGDTGGDLVGVGDHHIMLTPTGMKVNRQKLTVNKDTGETESAPVRAPAPMAGPAAAPPTAAPAPPASAPRPAGRRMNGVSK